MLQRLTNPSIRRTTGSSIPGEQARSRAPVLFFLLRPDVC
jgi:hypothetical protein